MKQQNLWLSVLLMGSMTTFISCSDDDGGGTSAPALEIESIMANGTDLETGENTELDLNAATAAEDVPLDATITIEFSGDVDASTATSSNINLTSGSTTVDAAVSASGSTVTLDPTEELERGTDYTLNITSSVKAADGGSFATVTRSFKTAGRAEVTPPQADSQVAYWMFNGDATAAVGEYDADEIIEIEWIEDRFGSIESAAYFDGDASLIEIPNGNQLLTNSITISYWIKVDSVGHDGGHFVMGLGDENGFFIEIPKTYSGFKLRGSYSKEDGTVEKNDFWFNGDGMDANNGGWEAIAYEANLGENGLGSLLDDKWAHVVYVFDAESNMRHIFINGALMETDDFNIPLGLSTVTGMTFNDNVEGQVVGPKLAFGFMHDRATTHWANEPWGNYDLPTSNHFKGALDDVRFFSSALNEEEISALYDAEKP